MTSPQARNNCRLAAAEITEKLHRRGPKTRRCQYGGDEGDSAAEARVCMCHVFGPVHDVHWFAPGAPVVAPLGGGGHGARDGGRVAAGCVVAGGTHHAPAIGDHSWAD